MKLQHLISLLQSNYYTAKFRYLNGSKPYTFKVPNDISLEVGDNCVVVCSLGFTVVRVLSIDEAPDIDIDADFQYLWIVQKIDPSAYYERAERETRIRRQLTELEKRKQQRSIFEQFKTMLGETDQQAFAALVKELNS